MCVFLKIRTYRDVFLRRRLSKNGDTCGTLKKTPCEAEVTSGPTRTLSISSKAQTPPGSLSQTLAEFSFGIVRQFSTELCAGARPRAGGRACGNSTLQNGESPRKFRIGTLCRGGNGFALVKESVFHQYLIHLPKRVSLVDTQVSL